MVTAGTVSAPIWLIGYTSVISDGGQVTIDGSSVSDYGLRNSGSSHYNVGMNINVINSTGTGINMGTAANYCFFYKLYWVSRVMSHPSKQFSILF